MKLTKCDAVKLESNNKNFDIINELVKSKIPVMGHIGYTPQFKKKFFVDGNTTKSFQKLLKEALLVEKAGAFSIVLECITPSASKMITQKLNELKEVIIATNPSVEGETTALYIVDQFKNTNVKVSRLARGLPSGGNLEYIDELTLLRSIAERVEITDS